jgi:hypothetical protein
MVGLLGITVDSMGFIGLGIVEASLPRRVVVRDPILSDQGRGHRGGD